jgi:protein phosphatase 1 regulatory subunit 37
MIDLSGVVMTHVAVEALGDILSVDFGLKKVILENCGLDDDVCLVFLSLSTIV